MAMFIPPQFLNHRRTVLPMAVGLDAAGCAGWELCMANRCSGRDAQLSGRLRNNK
jgi:hypothetical protein